jgi:hypothetical protein
MIEIHQDNLIPDVIYFIECAFTDEDIKPNKFRATLTKNTYEREHMAIFSEFNNVFFIDNGVLESYCDLSLRQPAEGSSYVWKFYQYSLPLYQNNRLNRLYRDATNQALRHITGDDYFTFY